MKKLKLLFLMLVMVMCLAISGCGGGFFAEEVIEIASIDSRVEADGTTILTITYVDDIRDPDVFKLPKGAAGNGIKSITSTKNIAGETTTVTITYTDDTQLPTTFDIKDGVSVKGVEPRTNEETGEISLVVVLSDGTESEPFPLPKGEKGEDGEDGNGLVGFDKQDGEDGSVTFTFHFAKTEDVVVTIPAPKQGEKGKGIDKIVGHVDMETSEYVLVISYTELDEEGIPKTDEVRFARPKDPNTWHTGSGNPNASADPIGRNGDFYFDIDNKTIYSKSGDFWSVVYSYSTYTGGCNIKFNLNTEPDETTGIHIEARMPDGYTRASYPVDKNTYFYQNNYGYVPIPIRDGHVFLGWYIQKNSSELSGVFNDFTVIVSDLELFAKWAKCFNVTFVTNSKQKIDTKRIIEGEIVHKPELDSNENLTFIGWYTDSEFINQYDFNSEVTKDLVLYAKWE